MLKCVSECVDMLSAAWHLGWHEYHAGNISYRLTPEDRAELAGCAAKDGPWTPLETSLPSLAGECFLISAAGSGFRTVDKTPEKHLGIVELDGEGSAWRVLWGLEGGRPTSELPAHLMTHAIKRKFSGEDYRIIYHAHPANLIALSFVLPLDDVAFTRELWEMEPECAMTFPQGIGVLPWVLPGSAQSALDTGEKMKRYDVVLWAYHGAFCAGTTFDQTFGVMHTVEKSAEILIKVISAGGKRQAPTADELAEMKEPFHLDLSDEFLFNK